MVGSDSAEVPLSPEESEPVSGMDVSLGNDLDLELIRMGVCGTVVEDPELLSSSGIDVAELWDKDATSP